jgi:hypothetical protein
VYVYSGTLDTVVHPGVVKKTAEFYGLVHANVTTDYTVPSEHCQPTIDFGNDCSKLATPYLSKCNFDGAGAALEVLLAPKALKPRGHYNPNNLQHVKVRSGRLHAQRLTRVISANQVLSLRLCAGNGRQRLRVLPDCLRCEQHDRVLGSCDVSWMQSGDGVGFALDRV